MKGKFIVLYGINNIGKSTQCKLLVEYFEEQGKKVKYIKYPMYDIKPTGPYINNILRGGEGQKISEEEFQIWMVLNRYQYQNELIELLEEGYYIIAEDYSGTGIAWGYTKGAELAWLEELNKDLLKADIEILIDGSRFIEAKEKKHIHEENDNLLSKCQNNLLMLAKKYDWHIVQSIPNNINQTFKNICTLF